MNPAFEFALCAISVLEKNFSYESVMALLRTGLVLDPENGGIDLLDFLDALEVAIFAKGADATGDGAVLRKGVAHLIGDHRVFAFLGIL